MCRVVTLTGPCPWSLAVSSPVPVLSPKDAFLLPLSAGDNTCSLQNRMKRKTLKIKTVHYCIEENLGIEDSQCVQLNERTSSLMLGQFEMF